MMKKILLFLWVSLTLVSLNGTQMYVVAELFTNIFCQYCPQARGVLRQMSEEIDNYPFLIPMIWQMDGHSSPDYDVRADLYSEFMMGNPHSQWNGTDHIAGGGASLLANYTSRYNQFRVIPATLDINIEIHIEDDYITATADISILGELTNLSEPKVFFFVTYNLDLEQPGDYFASVVRFADQDFDPSITTYHQSFETNSAWDYRKATVVVVVQNTEGPAIVHNAKKKRIDDNLPVDQVIAYNTANRVTLTWSKPPTENEVLGYNIYKSNSLLNTQPIGSLSFVDYDIEIGTTYNYSVSVVYEATESTLYNVSNVIPILGIAQLGSGTLLSGDQRPSPINIESRSLRGQFIYTANELKNAGMMQGTNIYSLGFYIAQSPLYPLTNFQIRLKHTSNSLPTSHDNGPFDMIHTIASYAPVAGDWQMIEFSTPFVWDGMSNLLIDTAFGLNMDYHSSGQVRVVRVRNAYRFIASDGMNVSNSNTNSLVSYKPQIRLNYNVGTVSVLNPPRDLTANKDNITTVSLSWLPPVSLDHFLGYRVYKNNMLISTPLMAVTSMLDKDFDENITNRYRVTAIYIDGESEPSNIVSFVSEIEQNMIPIETRLVGNYPNPFNPTTSLLFSVGQQQSSIDSEHITITIYNIKGQKVRNLVDNVFSIGEHAVIWDGTDDSGQKLSNGVYLYQLKTETKQEVKKMILLK
jgi:hypothetical protein